VFPRLKLIFKKTLFWGGKFKNVKKAIDFTIANVIRSGSEPDLKLTD
jgi:hypothetical protein